MQPMERFLSTILWLFSFAGFRLAAQLQFFRQSRHRIRCQLRGMGGDRGHPADMLHDIITPDPSSLGDRLGFYQLSHC